MQKGMGNISFFLDQGCPTGGIWATHSLGQLQPLGSCSSAAYPIALSAGGSGLPFPPLAAALSPPQGMGRCGMQHGVQQMSLCLHGHVVQQQGGVHMGMWHTSEDIPVACFDTTCGRCGTCCCSPWSLWPPATQKLDSPGLDRSLTKVQERGEIGEMHFPVFCDSSY